jgi:hypothetical protein
MPWQYWRLSDTYPAAAAVAAAAVAKTTVVALVRTSCTGSLQVMKMVSTAEGDGLRLAMYMQWQCVTKKQAQLSQC